MKKSILCVFTCLLALGVNAQSSEQLIAQNDSHNPSFLEPASPVYTTVDKQPEFPGGIAAMQTYIWDNLRCPDEAMQNAITGKVYVKFVVTEIGTIQNVEVVKSLKDCPSCDAAAMYVVEKMPSWKPGRIKDEAVKVNYTIPVQFRCE